MSQETDLQKQLKDNVQGDILGDGLLKQVELFCFFQIAQSKAADFRKALSQVVPLIANVRSQQAERERVRNEISKINAAPDATSQDARDKSVSSSQANIAFTSGGLSIIKNAGGNFDPDVSRDDTFTKGMEAHASALQDPPSQPGGAQPKWDPAFLGKQIHGVLLITANNNTQAQQKRAQLLAILGPTITEIKTVFGSAREGQLRRHEHFGFRDGVSEPGLQDFDVLKLDVDKDNREDINDKELIEPGIILCNRRGDPQSGRPQWATDGSFLVFRWLEQKVPEFNKDLGQKFAPSLGMSNTPENCDKIGARIIGRWKSGALVTTNPDSDPMPLSVQATKTSQEIDKVLNMDARVDFGSGSDKCPLGSHIRKMNPRIHFNKSRIIRRGIQFGPEVSQQESTNQKTDPNTKRGLLFACYQSHIPSGFSFIQQTWANNETFPQSGAGVDPMVGQQNKAGEYQMLGINKANMNAPISISFVNPYVVPLGGEYFFSPSMDALRNTLADNRVPPSPAPPSPEPAPPTSGPTKTVQVFIEDRMSGKRVTAGIPIGSTFRSISDFFPQARGGFMGLNQSTPSGTFVQVTDGKQVKILPSTQTPVMMGMDGKNVDFGLWKIMAKTSP